MIRGVFAIFSKKFVAKLLLYSSIAIVPMFNHTYVQAASSKQYETKYNVSLDKIWKIRFSREVDKSTLNPENIKILDNQGKEMPIDLSLDVDKHYVKIALKSGTYNGVHYIGKYEKDKKYTLIVKEGLMSEPYKNKKSKNLAYETMMEFNTIGDNEYPGLPIEDGLIVIGDKAYSVEYLSKHSSIANEITSNGNYYIAYISKEYGEKIKQVLGNNTTKGNQERANKILYYAPNGNQYEYEWNEAFGEYKIVLPKAYVDVTPGVINGVVNLAVKQVKAVPGAKYFKLAHSNTIKPIGESISYSMTYPTEKLTILSADETPLATALVDVYLPKTGYVSLSSVNETLGNTAGNISNNGSAAMDLDFYVYYVNSADKNSLYRKTLTGRMDTQISLDKAQYINVIGDWIYYSNYNDNGKIYKMKKDGTKKQILCDDTATYITVSGGVVYYANQSDKGRLYKINTDGTIDGGASNRDPAGKVHGMPVMDDYGNYNKATDQANFINVVGDWIYYSNFSDGHKIYTVNKDGNIRRKVNDEWADGIQIVGAWAYYCSGSGAISKVRVDGTGSVIPLRGTTRKVDKGYHLNIVDGWLYYSNAEDGGKLYRIKEDGSGEKKKLADLATDYINIVGDTMYLISGGKTYTLPLNTDGTIKPTLVTKDNNGNTVVDVKDLNITVAYEDANKTIGELEAKYLPQKVAVFMKDDTVQQLPVDWDIKNRKYNGQGIYTYTGTVLGHGKQIKCTLTIPSEMLNATSIIEVYNNGPKNGSIMIKERSFGPSKQDQELKEKLKLAKRVEIGDVIKVYDNPNSEKPLGNIKVDANNANGPLVKSLDLDMYGRSFWITITRKNKAESKPTEVRQLGAAVLSGDVLDEDGEALGVDGRDFTVKGWNNPSIRDDGFISDTTEIAAQGTKSIYVIPGTGKLNMENQGVIPAGITSANYWNGGNARALLTNYDLLTNDSLKNKLKEGNYSIYVVVGYDGKAEEDVNGFGSPLVIGKTASIPKVMKATEEKIPKAPSVTKQYAKSGDTVKISGVTKEDEIYLAPEGASYIAKDITNKPYKSHDNLFFEDQSKSKEERETGYEKSGKPSIEDGYQCKLVDGKIPQSVRSGKYKVYMVNAIGSSSAASGEIVVDNEDPVVRLDSAKQEDVIKHVTQNGTTTDEVVGQKFKVNFAAFDNSFDNSIKEGITVSIARLDSPKSAIKTQEIKDKGNKTFEVIINDPHANLNDYAIYAQDKAGNIGQVNLQEKTSATNKNTIALAIRTDQEGVDLVKSRLVGRTKYMTKDLTKVSDNYEVTVGTVKYALQEDSLRSLGVSPSIDGFMNALMQAKEWDSSTNKPKKNGSQLSSKVSIYKVNDIVYIEGNDKELIKINDKTKIGTDNAIVSNMIGLNPGEDNIGVDSKKQQYVVTVTGEIKNNGKLIVCLAGKCFNIAIDSSDTQSSIATKIATAINNNRILDGYENETAIATGNTVKLIRNYGGAVIPTFTIESFNYDN
ncbi:TPA: DUF5050 domain-containing protein [Clostridium botulinum]|uniref:DUF5050 domain-containing protein n=1 Tax=Clostridium botulinum TaxID=1491 RepID=UPI000D0DC21A|nr:DUF5050 domain-containing protein [Clostridium botulinum]PSM02390.1 basic protein [Clostridium botulinum]HDK7163290.1 DUF5050 domain-containing protein [Clostridium botulinum]HDK7170765.1 DUF5050 domain-containing protein [Clostridium botulinum]HDK7181819.1 DUF5050 domain-containing protein [Clostridium botulinum]HDK7185538.1 DUF5050 domain-containing protein [Clostridium botulinum]